MRPLRHLPCALLVPAVVSFFVAPRTAPAAPPAPPAADEITFKELSFRQPEPALIQADQWGNFTGLEAAGEGCDVVWSGGLVYLMKEPGVLRPLWWGPKEGRITLLNREHSIRYDGRYVWIATHQTAANDNDERLPTLTILDPKTEQTWQVTSRDGLPLAKGFNRFEVAPVAPGKACLVAMSIRGCWLATVTFDPKSGKKVRVFGQTKERRNEKDAAQRLRPTVHFQPGDFFFALGDKPNAQSQFQQRVLLSRGVPETEGGPLTIDPDDIGVKVLDQMVRNGPTGAIAVRDGQAYYAKPTWRHTNEKDSRPTIMRIGWPDFKLTVVAEKVFSSGFQSFAMTFYKDRVLVVADGAWVAEAPAGPYRRLSGNVPITENADDHVFFHSSHYGLVYQPDWRYGRLYAVEFAPKGK